MYYNKISFSSLPFFSVTKKFRGHVTVQFGKNCPIIAPTGYIWRAFEQQLETGLEVALLRLDRYRLLYWPSITPRSQAFLQVPGEFPTQRPVTRSFDVFVDLRLNKRLSKQSWGWWFETLSHPLWCHRNEKDGYAINICNCFTFDWMNEWIIKHTGWIVQ